MKKALTAARRVLVFLLVVFTVVIAFFTVLSFTSFNNVRGLFGYQFFVVLSDSMKDTFEAGDVVVSRQLDPGGLAEGDIITFRSSDPLQYGLVITHKIRRVIQLEGQTAFVTYGEATGEDDATPALASSVLGKYQFRVPKAGYVFDLLRSPLGYALIVLVPFLALFALLGVRFVGLMRAYRKEGREETGARDRALEEERRKNADIEEQLAQMRARLERLAAGPPAEPPVSETPDAAGEKPQESAALKETEEACLRGE